MTDFKENKQIKNASNFAKYTGVAFQMLGTIGIMTFIGYKIDENRASEIPIFTAVFGLVGVIISLIQIIRSLTKNK